MRSFCQVAVMALPLFSAIAAAEPKDVVDHPKTIYATAQEAFQDLLNALPEESLHAALSNLKDFKNGIFESHHRGVENIHSSNPALASKLIVDAVNDLRKRQTPSNGTNSATTASNPPESIQNSTPVPTTSDNLQPPETSSAAPPPPPGTSDGPANTTTTAVSTTTQQRPAIIPVENTVTKDGKTIVQTTEVLSEATASVAVTVVRTNTAGSTVTETENRPAVVKTTTDRAGRTTVTTSAVNFAPTAGEVTSTTNSRGSVVLTTITPGGSLVSSIKLITTTDAQGRQSTMTTYAFVDPVQATGAANSPNAPGNDKPSLQTGAAVANGAQYAAVGLGALAFFF
ncbi:hypothetical protein COCC4DRAFT_145806 [Bipolaris maydis ATCC 48331]|uniref:Uncharacterized protein n=2 Tax=Cochliobolus heterostrophus TaxID=5016 RepID=M2UJA0_COCH5|nr:uncharacterized protein COCC4DRAFT_145806 [Bipolaris maydis ATCC 48331]EMD88068.1 hypothetical protein COCHEDRAFT_1111589 [Bipolaris maydis C5]ENI02348.1 hypothetical protein COCC4DRAFT_145806 [Bipolaris maydis ATCC 48331]KAJ6207038.1 hypothetical protein PSV09DRAFT_1111589 [Bipolaris maydis]